MSRKRNRWADAADQNINSYGDRLTRPSQNETQRPVDRPEKNGDLWGLMSGSDNIPYDKESESDSESESALEGPPTGGQ
jgi:hypothetical protein